MSLHPLLANSNLMFVLGFALGLLFGDHASHLKETLIPGLIVIMSLSTAQIGHTRLIDLRKYGRDMLIVFVINYLFLSGLILLASTLFIRDHDLYAGFVIMAAIPSAVSVLPFTFLLKGDMAVSLFGSMCLYLAATIMAPLISFTFLDVWRIDLYRFIYTLGLMIILPLLLSRGLLKWSAFDRIREKTAVLINFVFLLTTYVIIGMNRSTFFRHFDMVILISSIAFLRTFFSGHLVDSFFRLIGTDRERRVSYVLFGSYKNLTLAATMAIVLFNERAAIPAVVTIPFDFLFFVWFNTFQKRWEPSRNP